MLTINATSDASTWEEAKTEAFLFAKNSHVNVQLSWNSNPWNAFPEYADIITPYDSHLYTHTTEK